jgi:hypothetical protein
MRRMCFGIRGFGGWRGSGVERRELKVDGVKLKLRANRTAGIFATIGKARSFRWSEPQKKSRLLARALAIGMKMFGS